MILASHNSWSYMTPERWWMRLFLPFSKCQTLSIKEQYNKGVRLFDLRIKPHGANLKAAHGIVEFFYTADFDFQWLDEHNDIYVRVLLESRRPTNEEIYAFRAECSILCTFYKNIHFFGGHGAHGSNWKTEYFQFNTAAPHIMEIHASVCEQGIKKILPKRFAEANNEIVKTQLVDMEGYLMMDFV